MGSSRREGCQAPAGAPSELAAAESQRQANSQGPEAIWCGSLSNPGSEADVLPCQQEPDSLSNPSLTVTAPTSLPYTTVSAAIKECNCTFL